MRLILAIAVVLSCTAFARAELKPFKDSLFAYPATLSQADGGAYRVIDYREMRDINDRDEVPERRVQRSYVDVSVRRQQQDLVARTGAGSITHFAVGAASGASAITVYVHGQGGSRRQGVDDFTFGGNFNRIKNLMARNGGLYLVPDFTDFGPGGAGEVAALIASYAAASPGAPVFVACGSMGGAICWLLANNPQVAPRLGGLILLGSHWSDDFARSAAFKRKVPVFIGHGSRDTVFPVERMEKFYRDLRAAGHPVRLVRFETGTHGTPIRMTDWRETINWMLATRPR